jgi:hypothetical protein
MSFITHKSEISQHLEVQQEDIKKVIKTQKTFETLIFLTY